MNIKHKANWMPWLLAVGLLLSLGIAAYFSYRALRAVPRLHASEEIRPWMTLPYIAHAQRVPVTALYQALDIPYEPHDRRPLYQIARSQGVPVDTIVAELQAAIQQLRPPGSPTPTHAPPQTAKVDP